MTKKTLEEHAEAVSRAECTPDRCDLPSVVEAYEAERKARMALEARVRELLDAHAKLLDRLETAKARVLELEAERSAWASSAGRWAGEATAQEDARHVAEAGLSVSETVRRHDEADLAETRAQLERLREAALMLADRVRAEGGHGHRVHELSDRVRDALSIPGPTLASVRAEALRWDALNAERSVWTARAEKAEATLAETRARLTGLWEAAGAVDEADASGDDTVLGVAIRRLRAALSNTGPTLAEIRRAAQVEVLRELAKEMAPPAAPTMGSATWDAWRERIARRFGTFDAVAIHDWLRQRADDVEAGRG